MNTQINSWARFRKAATLQIDLPTLVPLTVVTCAAPVTLTVWERYGTVAVYFVLVGWCGVLFGSAAWLNYALFRRSSTFRPFLVAIVGILSIWFWQEHAFAIFIPPGLTYGYFLRPDRAMARFWVLNCPLWLGLTCLAICCIYALVAGWRAGARFSLACMIPWWLAASLIFALPSMYLDAQGNASVFI